MTTIEVTYGSSDLIEVTYGAADEVTIRYAGVAGPQGPTGATGPAGADGAGVPVGGSTGQVLAKASGTDYDTEWVDRPNAVAINSGATESMFGLPGVDLYGDGTSMTFAGGFTQTYGPFLVEFPITVTEAAINVTLVGTDVHQLALCRADNEWQPIANTELLISANVPVNSTGVKIVTGLDIDLSVGRWLTINSQLSTSGGNTQCYTQSGAPSGFAFLPDNFSSSNQSGRPLAINPSALTDQWTIYKHANSGRGVQQSVFLKWKKQ